MKSLDKMTKAELLAVITAKDIELFKLRDQLSCANRMVEHYKPYHDRQARENVHTARSKGFELLRKARQLSVNTGLTHKVHMGCIEKFENNHWSVVP